MCKKVTIFVSCSKSKKRNKAPAYKMYQGALFKKSLKYALIRSNSVYILSAKYGILSLNQIIEPYEKTLNKMSKVERLNWAEMVKTQMKMNQIKPPFIFLTGSRYNEYFEGEKPLTGLSLGFQLKWFNTQLKINKNTLL